MPVIGVAKDDLDGEQLVERVRESCVAAEKDLDESVFERLSERVSYVRGDYKDPKTFQALAKKLDDCEHPVFYLEIPPSLFAPVVQGLGRPA